MIELELLASKAAVAHILGRDAEGLYQSDSKPGDLAARICSLLSRAYLDGVWVTTQRRVEIPGDTQIRIRAVADQLARRAGAQSLPDLWPVVREWMEEQVGGSTPLTSGRSATDELSRLTPYSSPWHRNNSRTPGCQRQRRGTRTCTWVGPLPGIPFGPG